MNYEIPILLIIFNRADITRQLIDKLRPLQPGKIYVSADGPRADVPGDVERCKETRSVIQLIDWECDVKTNFLDNNVGCGIGPATAISWLFKHEEMGIILEDDCMPSPGFFNFCNQVLIKYKNDERVMHVSGNSFHGEKKWGDASYFFSIYAHSWGWATWKRAWDKFDITVSDFPEFVRARKLLKMTPDISEQAYWFDRFEKMYHHKLPSVWDYAWMYTMWNNLGLAVYPNVNMVSNIGTGDMATHTTQDKRKVHELPTTNIAEIKHPSKIESNQEADRQNFIRVFKRHPLVNLIFIGYYLYKRTTY